ncbi:MAG: hypothetical protein SPJ89_06040 [Treponema sp.]|nr:hypothetical protein [Treponema sp.]
MATATKIYEIADGVAITSNGVILNEGQEVTEKDFASKEVFEKLIKAKKIVQVTSTGKRTSASRGGSNPTSSTGATEPTPESTTPSDDGNKTEDSEDSGSEDDDAGGDD